MIVLDVIIWVILPFLNFLYWLDVGEEAFIRSHLQTCGSGISKTDTAGTEPAVQQHMKRLATGGEGAMSLPYATEDLSHIPPHFSSLNAKSFQQHRGNNTLYDRRCT